jgi:hypothetical protein
MDPLFPELPEDLTALSDEDLASLLTEHNTAADLIDAEDEQALRGLEADDVLAQYEAGVSQIETIEAEQQRRIDAQEEYFAKKAELAARRKPAEEKEETEETEDEEAEESEELAAEAVEVEVADEPSEEDEDEPAEESKEDKVLVAAAVPEEKKEAKQAKPLRRPPAPSIERQLKAQEQGAVLLATAGQMDIREGTVMDERKLAEAMHKLAKRQGPVHKSETGNETKYVVAAATYDFPSERQLEHNNLDLNRKLIRDVIPESISGLGGLRGDALVASGGLCAPLPSLYTLPNFASQARPVRDALPSFSADRGGVSVPEAHIIGSIDDAISLITESMDAAGGTFATKSCQDFDCTDWTDVTVTTISHCREYGNLNSRAWPEGIELENQLTLAAHARTAEQYLLSRIKAQSVKVTRTSEVLNATSDLLYDVLRLAASIRYNLRMNDSARFQVLFPTWIQDLLVSDLANVQFDRFKARSAIAGILAQGGVSVSYYQDGVGSGTDQGFAEEVDGSAIDDFPDDVQFALFPAGAFIHVDGGSLELGIVRDSTLNRTNDYQIFGETFENVARIAPLQATRWATVAVCPSGEFPSLTTALSC